MFAIDSRSLAVVAALSLLASAGCAEDLELSTDDGPAETVATEPLDDGSFMTRVDASSSDEWIYFSFVSGGQVIPLDPANSSDWDLGFQRFHIISNGGASGSGGSAVAVLLEQQFDAVLSPPTDGYVVDQPDSDDSDTVVDTVFEEGDGWYAYDDMTNRLSPRANVYVVQTTRGAHYKLSIVDYYDSAGSSGHPSFSWAEL
ncbi:MAG TPA: HmuY family protein [Polyangiaceae bacterium]|nr:HmuY family protein [Polyangiaceae bacterium]